MSFETPQMIFRNDLAAIKIFGGDRIDFLNRLCSQKIITASLDTVLPAAFLRANGTAIALFHVWIRADHVVVIFKKILEPQVLKFIDDFHFGEDLKIESWQGLKIAELRQNKVASPSLEVARSHLHYFVLPLESWKILSSEDVIQRAYVLTEVGFDSVAQDFSAILINDHLDYEQRAYSGVPSHPEELTDSNIILEGPFGEYVHRNKGCYPGQEVIERIYTYGNVAKKIFTFKINGLVSNTESLKHAEICSEGKPVGSILSLRETSDGVIGFAIAKRLPLENKQRLEVIDSTGSYLIFSL